jgi:outer membrane protein assembly factor BamB
MSSEPVSSAARGRWVRYVGLGLGPGLAALGIGLLWWLMASRWDLGYRVFFTGTLTIFALAWTIGWLLLYSRHRWWVLGGVVGLVMLACAAIRTIDFSGDLFPAVVFRWEPTGDDILEAHRRRTGPSANTDPGVEGPADFPEYRGRKRDGVAHGPPLARDWQAHPPRQRWRQPCGGGYSAFAVAGNLAVTIEQRRDYEVVVCYDAQSGKERWIYQPEQPARFYEPLGGEGPRATPTIAGRDVYSLGAQGHLACLDLHTGQRKWAADILAGNDNLAWGMSGSPLVYDNVVVVNPGVQRSTAAGKALVAFDCKTGAVVWTAGNHKAGYSSPMLAELCGQKLILLFDGEGIAGHDAATGRELWRFPWSTQQDIHVAQPLVLPGDRVLISSGYGVGCALLQLSRTDEHWQVEPIWKNRKLRCKFTSPVLHNGFVYGLDEGILVCLDPASGEQRWKEGRYGHGQLLVAGDLLVIQAESGQLVLVEATPEAFRELARFQAIDGRKTWNNPALANGHVYLRNHQEMACYDLRAP